MTNAVHLAIGSQMWEVSVGVIFFIFAFWLLLGMAIGYAVGRYRSR